MIWLYRACASPQYILRRSAIWWRHQTNCSRLWSPSETWSKHPNTISEYLWSSWDWGTEPLHSICSILARCTLICVVSLLKKPGRHFSSSGQRQLCKVLFCLLRPRKATSFAEIIWGPPSKGTSRNCWQDNARVADTLLICSANTARESSQELSECFIAFLLSQGASEGIDTKLAMWFSLKEPFWGLHLAW